MVYSQKFVACIKVNGQILRESDNTVSIPFGSEYSVLLKNLNSRRVQVKVSVDGKDVTEGTWLVIGPNQSIELERYISDGNFQSGNRFKFIPMTKAIEKHRGLKSDDGLVRVEYKTEKVTTAQDVHITRTHHHDVHQYNHWYGWPYYWPSRPYIFNYETNINSSNGSNLNDNVSFTSSSSSGSQMSQQVQSVNMMAFNKSDATTESHGLLRGRSFTKSSAPTRSLRPQAQARASAGRRVNVKSLFPMEENDALGDDGITVPGSESHQKFQSVAGFPVHEQSEVVILKLRGAIAGAVVTKAVTVKTKATCPTCGKKSKGDKKFCAACGTSLSLI